MTSRRDFLKQTSAAAAFGLLNQIPARQLLATVPQEFLPEPDEALLRELALKAMDAARGAGAHFADIRLMAARGLGITCVHPRDGGSPNMGAPGLVVTFEYGVRAIVEGAWGFAQGTELTTDAVTQAACTAVAVARANRPRRARTFELAPTPRVADAVWATPIAQDPFEVPIGEQGDLALAALAEAAKVREVMSGFIRFEWRRPTVVFASTDGSLALLRLTTANPGAGVSASVGPDVLSEADGGVELLRGGYGYEAVRAGTLAGEMREAAERAVELARAARTAASAEVGRYDLVLGPTVVANLLASTVAAAVDLERALGYRANASGTSFAAPPSEILGKYQVASKLITVQADRSQLHGAATVGWDDEGVEPEDYTFVQDGVIMDYHTNRQTAMELAGWYEQRGEPTRSHGCARRVGTRLPSVRVPNLTLVPATESKTVEDLIADTRRGFYIEGTGPGASDQQLLSAQYSVRHTQVREIRQGKLGGYVKDLAFQFITPQFWRNVDALGGPSSARSIAVVTDPLVAGWADQPFLYSTVRSVPIRARDVNVLNTGGTT